MSRGIAADGVDDHAPEMIAPVVAGDAERIRMNGLNGFAHQRQQTNLIDHDRECHPGQHGQIGRHGGDAQ